MQGVAGNVKARRAAASSRQGSSAAVEEYRQIPLAMLRAGSELSEPVYDNQGRLLIAGGVPLTEQVLLGLFKHGVRTVLVNPADWQRLSAFSSQGTGRSALPSRFSTPSNFRNAASDDLDRDVAQLRDSAVVPAEQPFADQVRTHGKQPYDAQQKDQLYDNYQANVDHVGEMLSRLSQGDAVASQMLQSVSSQLLMHLAEDIDLFSCMGVNPLEHQSLFAHTTNVAMLAMAIGTTLGLDDASLQELGIGCLVHDVGMLHLDPELYESPRILDPLSFAKIARHPVISLELLQQHTEPVALGIRMVVYQMHERCHGGGYPRGTPAERIHPLAKIAGVADAYVAMVSDRPHRPALLPYAAMVQILEDVNVGLFDPFVARGLLHTISLFPLGSFVQLPGSRVARTLRSNGPQYTQPIVEAWPLGNVDEPPGIVDLAEAGIHIERPVRGLR